MIQDSFMTGSRVFGYARPSSDFDVVVLCEKGDFRPENSCLDADADYHSDKAVSRDWESFKFGEVNYIACYTVVAFAAWKTATETTKAQILDRAKAHELFQRTRDTYLLEGVVK